MPAEQRAFIDSNVVLYALGTETSKQQAAWRILFQFPLISVQIMIKCAFRDPLTSHPPQDDPVPPLIGHSVKHPGHPLIVGHGERLYAGDRKDS